MVAIYFLTKSFDDNENGSLFELYRASTRNISYSTLIYSKSISTRISLDLMKLYLHLTSLF